jgi:hypothetical protein
VIAIEKDGRSIISWRTGIPVPPKNKAKYLTLDFTVKKSFKH